MFDKLIDQKPTLIVANFSKLVLKIVAVFAKVFHMYIQNNYIYVPKFQKH